jgi:hypothetical protein
VTTVNGNDEEEEEILDDSNGDNKSGNGPQN